MAVTAQAKLERRARARNATRAAILEAARRVAARDGARNLSLRAAAGEAGFAPAALYGYFENKDELLLALAADDLAALARAIRGAAQSSATASPLAVTLAAALTFLQHTETLAAASSASAALAQSGGRGDAERHFNGRLIAALNALSDATGRAATSRGAQIDVVLLAAALTGLAALTRSGRLAALGFTRDEAINRLDGRFSRAL